jgi:putative transposase
MVERPGKDLSVRRQCALLNLARSGVYRPKPVAGADDLVLMRRIDELHLEKPFYGSRRMTFELNEEGRGVNRKRVQRLMRVMGIEALVPRPGTSKAAPGHKIYPYLLRGLSIIEPNHVWAADITYIPMARGFLYLVAIISRRLRSNRPGLGQPRGSGLAAVEHDRQRILRRGAGGGVASTREAEDIQYRPGVSVHLGGFHRQARGGERGDFHGRRGRFMDNIFIERLWRSIKYEEVHLKAYADGREARVGISSWMTFYNFRRPHQAMNNQMPMAVWRAGLDKIEAAAKAVDMPLRLDNANALPTYPQRRQKQQEAA